jgi:phosphoglycerol transferase MdoB-like AlkP superfamily enzyme
MFLKKYPASIILTILSIFLLTISFLGYIDFVRSLLFFEKYELDEFILAVLLISLGIIIDFNTINLRHKVEIQKQKLAAIFDTVRNAKYIVNNFLHNIQMFEMEASKHLSDESKLLFRAMIEDTVEKINGLEELSPEELI